MGVTHTTQTAESDNPAYDISANEWNATHSFDGNLAFPATQLASADANTLDDYEEGSFTPVLTFATAGNLSVTYSTQNGTYVKIGKVVIFQVVITTSAFTHTTASGGLLVTGLPFTVSAQNQWAFCGMEGFTKANYTIIVANPEASQTRLRFFAYGSGQAQSQITTADMPTGGTVRVLTAGYYVI